MLGPLVGSRSGSRNSEHDNSSIERQTKPPFSGIDGANSLDLYCNTSSSGGPNGSAAAAAPASARSSSDTYYSGSSTCRSSCDTNASSTSMGSLRSPLNRHHKHRDLAWHAINSLRLQGEDITMSSLKVLSKLGEGDSGSVYLAQLRGTTCLFALKMVDKHKLLKKNKIHRLHIERDILELLDHPFLPALYAHFEIGKFSCLLMEYCPRGSLQALIYGQLQNHITMKIVRFLATELVVALEYLHSHGIIYRDLKPENVLLQENGHIMLCDFDLCARYIESKHAKIVNLPISSICSPSRRRLVHRQFKTNLPSSKEGKVIWLHAVWSYLRGSWAQRRHRFQQSRQEISRRRQCRTYTDVMVEPHLRTFSMVGTHEYLAPEVLEGMGHGSAVDWWMLGVLIYELVYGTTPFKGQNNMHTLSNIRTQRLRFPVDAEGLHVSDPCKSLLRGLLTKDPSKRLGSFRGACEIKEHSFFKGLNWALIRAAKPPNLFPVSQNGNQVSPKLDYF